MINCQKLLLLLLTLKNALPVHTIDCYVCNSKDDPSCEPAPTRISRCPNRTTGCSKTIMKDLQFTYVVNNTRINIDTPDIEEKHYLWNGEDSWMVIIRPIYVTVRKCHDFYIPSKGCFYYEDEDIETTVCACRGSLCNNAVKLQINLKIIIWLNILQIIHLNS